MSRPGDEEKYHWIVMFNEHGKVYTYMYRTVPHMITVVKKFHSEHFRYPYRIWAIVDGVMDQVEIKTETDESHD